MDFPTVKCCKKGILLSCALSGGADSMALFHALCCRAQDVWGLRSARGSCEPRPARRCCRRGRRLCAAAQCLLARGRSCWSETGCSRRLKTRARRLGPAAQRYGFFERTAVAAQAQGGGPVKVATAHTCSATMPKRCCSIWPAAARPAGAGGHPALCAGRMCARCCGRTRADVLAYLARCGRAGVM